jgi:transcriptional accessory protein Tex/SPT6
MAGKKQAAKARKAASGASPYVQRVAEDAELRDNVRTAFDNAKSAYSRLTNGKPATKVLDDKKLHKEVRQAAEALRDAGQALREGPQKKRRGGFGKLLLLAIVGGGLAVALNEGLRNKVLDLLFGAEEEFDYTSTPASSPPSPVGSS